MTTRRRIFIVAIGLLAAGASLHIATAQSVLERIHSFGQSNSPGLYPGPLARGPGGFYGATECCVAGTNGQGGTLYRLDDTGAASTVLLKFGDLASGNMLFKDFIVASDQAIYGFSIPKSSPGSFGLIKIQNDGSAYQFVLGPPQFVSTAWDDLLEASDGRLYGLGGPGALIRTVKKDGSDHRAIHTNLTSGGFAQAMNNLIEGRDQALYFTDQNDAGNTRLNRMNKDGTGRTMPFTFAPFRGVAQLISSADGFLYGTTSGFVDVGSVAKGAQFFRVKPDGTDFAVLHEFELFIHPMNPSFAPYGNRAFLLEGSDGLFYGTFATGGHTHPGYAFRINRNGSGYTRLLDFPASYLIFDPGTPYNQSTEKPIREASNGVFVGTTRAALSGAHGFAFRFNKDGSGFTTTASFSQPTFEGTIIASPLANGGDGFLYGAASAGGSQDEGTLWRLQPDGSRFEVLRSMLTSTDGESPRDIIVGSNGKLYGAASAGLSGFGTVFRMNKDGSGFQVLRAFVSTGNDGRQPMAAPIEVSNVLYGTTYFGGGAAAGTVFKLNTDGSGYQVLHRFTNSVSGQNPTARLLAGADGRLYGATESGGPQGGGVVFALNTNGSGFTVLRFFSTNGTAIRTPRGALVQATDGTLYSTTSSGGADGFGAIFKHKPDGSDFAILRPFSAAGGDGRQPDAGLVFGAGGKLYGTTRFGGGSVNGSVFRINPDGTGYEKLYAFGSATGDGANPAAALTVLPDGTLFGTTFAGGNLGHGTVFRISAMPLVLRLQLLSDGRLEFRWPVAFTNYLLQSNTNLANTNGWVPVTNTPASIGGEFQVAFPKGTDSSFYRLFRP